ncbi:response regulator [Candidatus Sumerlaeota bacterium]|nr:response regulator [Candidatus Sumerlaeota bacterium]
MARILTIDDDKDCLAILRGFLMVGKHEPLPLLRADRVVDAVKEVNPDLVITDLMMPGVTGGLVYQAIRKSIGPFMPIIVSSGSNLKLKLPDDPLVAYCPKPVEMNTLLKAIDELLAKAAAAKAQAEA